jgi:ABC-type uncharacterized transport system substrate-binding protein
MLRRLAPIVTVCVATLGFAAGPARAHPHVFVDARTEIVFHAGGPAPAITAIRNIWQFDPAFSEYAIQGLDVDGDGKVSDEELKPLAKVNVDSLKEYDFFTYLLRGREEKSAFAAPHEYWLEFRGGRLTLFYTLPLKEPVPVGKGLTLEIFDPEYFVAFTFMKEKPITLVDAPAGCEGHYKAPHELDNATMAALAAIPADQRDLPPELQDATVGLAHTFVLVCK